MQQPIIEHQTKPASEWICGRVVRKVSPRERHSRAQRQMTIALGEWAEKYGTGRVGPEWEFRIAPPGEVHMPIVAPNAAIEILSPRDRRQYVDEKIRVYLGSGSDVVIIVDPQAQTVALHDRNAAAHLDASGPR